jgi:mannose-1-phosphate guanylyltransferase
MSRAKRPKQFLALAGKHTLLRDTWDRARGLAPELRPATVVLFYKRLGEEEFTPLPMQRQAS